MTATFKGGIAEELEASAKTYLRMRGKDLFAVMAVDAIRHEIAHYCCRLGERAIDQTRRQVLGPGRCPMPKKSIQSFEPPTDPIKTRLGPHIRGIRPQVSLPKSPKGLIPRCEVLRETLRTKFM
jgi:hypothetical protein